MKILLTLILSFFLFDVSAEDSIVVFKKKEIYFLTTNCKDSITWEEIILKDKDIQRKINESLYSIIEGFKLKESFVEGKCNNDILYQAQSRIVYSKDNIVSILSKGHFIWPNEGYDIKIKALNYNLSTGKLISFHELFNSDKVSSVDSLIIEFMKEWHTGYEISFDDNDLQNWRTQLQTANFNINENEIILYLRGIHCGYCTDDDPEFRLSFNEYKSYFDKKGILGVYLNK
jgi:hypothetical protein